MNGTSDIGLIIYNIDNKINGDSENVGNHGNNIKTPFHCVHQRCIDIYILKWCYKKLMLCTYM